MARLLDRYVLFYPMRFLGATFLILITALHLSESGRFGASHVVLIGVLFVHPHVVFLLRRRYDRRRVEAVAFLVDAFLLGLVLYVTGFSLLPSLILVTVALANALAVNGFGHMLLSGLALAAGVTLPMLVSGFNVDPRDSVAIDAACSAFLFVYFNFFAYSAYNRSRLLEQSQADLRR
jgi:cytochrome bd-type quinol oxidase subunit 2